MIVYRTVAVVESANPQEKVCLPMPCVALIVGEAVEAKHARFLGEVRALHEVHRTGKSDKKP